MFSAEEAEEVVKVLVNYVEKDKHIETLLHNLCIKMNNSLGKESQSSFNSEMSEVKITAFTISTLGLSEKHLPKLMDHYDHYKIWIQRDPYVRK